MIDELTVVKMLCSELVDRLTNGKPPEPPAESKLEPVVHDLAEQLKTSRGEARAVGEKLERLVGSLEAKFARLDDCINDLVSKTTHLRLRDDENSGLMNRQGNKVNAMSSHIASIKEELYRRYEELGTAIGKCVDRDVFLTFKGLTESFARRLHNTEVTLRGITNVLNAEKEKSKSKPKKRPAKAKKRTRRK